VLARRNVPLLAALVCLLGLIAVGVLALLVPAGHERDAAMLHGFVALDHPSVHFEIKVLAHLGDTLPYACAGLLCIAVALVRRRGWRALTLAGCAPQYRPISAARRSIRISPACSSSARRCSRPLSAR
jgi:hypothetical protein